MAQNADLPISCKNFSGVPNPRPVLGHRPFCFQIPAVLAHTTFR